MIFPTLYDTWKLHLVVLVPHQLLDEFVYRADPSLHVAALSITLRHSWIVVPHGVLQRVTTRCQDCLGCALAVARVACGEDRWQHE